MTTDNNCSCGTPWRDFDDRCFRCKRSILTKRAELLPFHRELEELAPCACSETISKNWGSRKTNIDGVFLCNFCDAQAESLNIAASDEQSQLDEVIPETPPKFEVPISGRSAQQNLEVVETLLANLAAGKKYKKAISSGEFALFTLIGTTDWEDYASLSIDALQLLTLAQINTNLEEIRKLLEK